MVEALPHEIRERFGGAVGGGADYGTDGEDGADDDERTLLLLRFKSLNQLFDHDFGGINNMIRIHLRYFFTFIVGNIREPCNLLEAGIENQDGHVELLKLIGYSLPVFFQRSHLTKVCNNSHCFEIRVIISTFFSNFFKFFVYFVFVSGNNANIESFPRQFLAHGEANAVRATSDYGPTGLSE